MSNVKKTPASKPAPKPAPRITSADKLSFTLFVAIAVHAVIIFGIALNINKGKRVSPTLNVTLATHQSKIAPEKADFIAQFNQEASGTEKEALELTAKERTPINDVKANDVRPQEQIKAQQKQVLKTEIVTTQGESNKKTTKSKDINKDSTQEKIDGQDVDIEKLQAESASLRAKIDKIKQERAKMPRVRRLTSVSTKMAHDALYLNNWTEKFEAIGNKHFPEAAIQNEIFGSLRIKVILLPDGSVEEVEILNSSNHPILDAAVMQFVHLAAPFDQFPPEIRNDTDKIEIYRTVKLELSGLSTSAG